MISAIRSAASGMMFSRVSGLYVRPSTTVAVPSQLLPTTSTSRVGGAAAAGAALTRARPSAKPSTARRGSRPTGSSVPRLLQACGVSNPEPAPRAGRGAPARAGSGGGGEGVVAARVEAQAGHHHVHVGPVGVDRDPAPRAGLTEVREARGIEWREQEAAPVEGVGHRTRAVVAPIDAGEAAVPAAPAIALADQAVGGDQHVTHYPGGPSRGDGT